MNLEVGTTTPLRHTHLDNPMQCFFPVWLALVCEGREDTGKNG
jgi:hypothetical protein